MKWHQYRVHKDARRAGAYDIVPGLPGDFNFTIHPKGVIPEELHLHKKQTDYFAIAKGKVMFRLVNKNGKEKKILLTDKDAKTLIIPPGIWHGYTALEPSIMVFYISHKYDPNDEFRQKTKVSEWRVPKRFK